MLMRIDNVREPSTISELRAIHRAQPAREGTRARDTEGLPCELPPVAVLTLTAVVSDPTSTLQIALPREWREIGRLGPGDEIRIPYTRYENSADWRFTVYRVPTGAVGPTWDASPDRSRLATEDCEVSNEKSGVIWAFRTADRNGVPRYTGNGDGVSAHGRRYKFAIGAPTRAERDSLAAFLSLAITFGVPETIAGNAPAPRAADSSALDTLNLRRAAAAHFAVADSMISKRVRIFGDSATVWLGSPQGVSATIVRFERCRGLWVFVREVAVMLR